MDYFGPFTVKRGRAFVKQYGVIFTCLSIRAVHIEIAFSLDVNSCIDAVRRFISRRGPVKVLWWDNSTNLVGACHELQSALDSWNAGQIEQALTQHGIEWNFNPPTGSHFGGVWERLIRSVRKVLHGLLQACPRNLDDEVLMTMFCEVESILNNRPITKLSDDPSDAEALTPDHLLLLRPGPQLPPSLSQERDQYATRRWKQVQFIADSFWRRWSREYLVLLQERQKWVKPKENVSVGDIVLLMDSTPRSSWALGRITDVVKDNHGLERDGNGQSGFKRSSSPHSQTCTCVGSRFIVCHIVCFVCFFSGPIIVYIKGT